MLSYFWPTSNSSSTSSSTSTPTAATASTTFSASLLSHFPESGSFPPSSPPNPHPLNSFWTKNFDSPLSNQGSRDALPSTADIVIIGSGLTGVCAVDRLVEKLSLTECKEKVKIVVLEARDFCSGATARNGGHLTASPLLAFATLESTFGTEEAKRCVALEQYSIDWIIEACEKEGWSDDVDLRVGGGNLHVFDTKEDANRIRFELDAARKANQDLSGFEWLDPQQVRERYQAESKAGGVLIPGNNVWPIKLVTKFFQRAQRHAKASKYVSLDLFTHCAVSKVERSQEPEEPARWNVETASRGTISARHVLHCTNGYLSSVLPQFATGPSRIYPTRGQVISVIQTPATQTSSSSVNNALSKSPSNDSSWPKYGNAFLAESPFDIYMFQRSKGEREIILGGCRDRAGPKENYEFGKSYDGAGSVNETVGKGLRDYLSWQFPKVFSITSGDVPGKREESSWKVDMEWTGIMGFREGGIPIVGPVYIDQEQQHGQWVAAGYSGHGMPRAPASGHLLASLVLDALASEKSSSSKSPKFKLPAHFPRHYLTTSNGLPDVKATVPAEVGFDIESGWVWVDLLVEEEKEKRDLTSSEFNKKDR